MQKVLSSATMTLYVRTAYFLTKGVQLLLKRFLTQLLIGSHFNVKAPCPRMLYIDRVVLPISPVIFHFLGWLTSQNGRNVSYLWKGRSCIDCWFSLQLQSILSQLSSAYPRAEECSDRLEWSLKISCLSLLYQLIRKCRVLFFSAFNSLMKKLKYCLRVQILSKLKIPTISIAIIYHNCIVLFRLFLYVVKEN